MSTTTVPVTITPEAAARAAELGLQREVEMIVDHLKQNVADLSSIEVEEAWPYDTGDETNVLINAYVNRRWTADDPTKAWFRDWKINTFPPRVCWYLSTLILFAPNHGR